VTRINRRKEKPGGGETEQEQQEEEKNSAPLRAVGYMAGHWKDLDMNQETWT
jgi:hypothetical protein